MSRSRKKICAGTCCKCKSQKKGKVACHKKFRRSKKLLYKMREAVNQYDKGVQSKRQKKFQKIAENNGYKYAICRNVLDFVNVVKNYNEEN